MTVLVTAASKHGSTGELADAIAHALHAHGVDARRAEPDDVTDIRGYDAVVLGSAVYAGGWLEPARRFALEHRDALAERPTWLFSSGPVGEPLRPGPGKEVDIEDIVVATGAREHRVLPGKLDPAELGFAERAIARAVGATAGDFRDWDGLAEWVAGIAQTCRLVQGAHRTVGAGRR